MEQDNINLVPYTCLVCDGVLIEISLGLYQCPMGHQYTLQELIAKYDQSIETLVWTLYRRMNERTHLLKLVAQQEPDLSSLVEKQAFDSSVEATIVRGLLRGYK